MKMRVALKVLKKCGVVKYSRDTLLKACRVVRRLKHRKAKAVGVVPGCHVIIGTATAYDGVPVSVAIGSRDYVR